MNENKMSETWEIMEWEVVNKGANDNYIPQFCGKLERKICDTWIVITRDFLCF